MAEKADEVLSRRQLARELDLHPDSLTRNLPRGLGWAVVTVGGRGKEMTFSRARALRWHGAWTCRAWAGAPCGQCRSVLDDCSAMAEHLSAVGHAYGGCPECRVTWELTPPCGRGRR